MNKKEIIENNRLISKFIGLSVYSDDGLKQYHKDWNELHRVLEKLSENDKIEIELSISNHTWYASIVEYLDEEYLGGNFIEGYKECKPGKRTLKELTYEALVEYIKKKNNYENTKCKT